MRTTLKYTCIDEERVASKSKGNQFNIRNPDKHVRIGWTINNFAEVGEMRGSFESNHVVKVGKATYADVSNGKTYNIVNQLLSDEKGD